MGEEHADNRLLDHKRVSIEYLQLAKMDL